MSERRATSIIRETYIMELSHLAFSYIAHATCEGRTGTAFRETTVIWTPFPNAHEYTAEAAAKSNMLFTELSGL